MDTFQEDKLLFSGYSSKYLRKLTAKLNIDSKPVELDLELLDFY